MDSTDMKRDRPWIFRTYAGHSSAAQSNKLYRSNLAKGQTGLSIAFDLPTQTGLDADHPLAKGEIGKVGVPIGHLGDMRALFNEIPLGDMNTSMTINATAPWLLALYIAVADEQDVRRDRLAGTTQNDILKEYLSRGTYMIAPEPALQLSGDIITYCWRHLPRWNPINICSYHLQEAGATPVQELAFSLANALAVLDHVRGRPEFDDRDFAKIFGRISFFVNAGMAFITEMCKMRAFVRLWDDIGLNRYGVTDDQYRRFRYGVQVNSLGLTEQQPENNVYRILIETLAVVLSRDARARAVQLPAWNEALGLPRSWDQQWSLRLQQILAYETDLLEFDDIFAGSDQISAKVNELVAAAEQEIRNIEELGGCVAAIESSYMKRQLVQANADRLQRIESGEQTVVGVNRFTETEPSPLMVGEQGILTVGADIERRIIQQLHDWRADRDDNQVEAALSELRNALVAGANVMEPSIACAKAGVTTGEWGDAIRDIFGTYRAPTGVVGGAVKADNDEALIEVRKSAAQLAQRLGRPIKLLVGKPGLDGHSNGAEQIAVRARDAGLEVVYEGIRLTPAEIVNAALEEGVHIVGLSILSGSHMVLAEEILTGLRAQGMSNVPVVIGGIIPSSDRDRLEKMGVAAIFTPRDFELTDVMARIVALVDEKYPVRDGAG